MKNNELIERYVYAVVRQLPAKQRADIEKELKSLINDMLEERCGDMAPSEHDVNVVLAELGKPSELAARYDPDGERSLIGPRYYRRYIQTLKLALPCVGLGMLVAAIISTLVEGINPGASFQVNGLDFSWIAHVFSWIGNIVTSLVTAAAVITLVFAVFEYKNVTLDEDDISKLPVVPKRGQKISKGESIADIILSVVFGAVFILVPQVICAISTSGDGIVTAIPVFDVNAIRSMWVIWLGLIVLSVGRDCFGLIEGVYSVRYAVVSCVADIVSAVGVVLALCRGSIMNPEFTGAIGELFKFEPDAEFLTGMFENFNLFLMGVWLFALALDAGTAVFKAVMYRRENADS